MRWQSLKVATSGVQVQLDAGIAGDWGPGKGAFDEMDMAIWVDSHKNCTNVCVDFVCLGDGEKIG